MFDAEFFVALGGIIVADLVLAGDNAVVIALAARNLPPELRRRAVIFGASAAIALRTMLTIAAVYLLKSELPVVMLVGGIALLYIAWQLAIEEPGDPEGLESATTMRGAIRTILIADVVMSIDNVLAVAAIGKQNVWLVIIGLLISIPIVMGGASFLLRVIDRMPLLVWVGAALIAYVGMELVLVDPILRDVLPHELHEGWIERGISVGVAVLLTSIAWYVRTSDDDSDSRLMVEGSNSDD